MLRGLAERWERPRFLMRPAVSLIKLNPGMSAAIERLAATSNRPPTKGDVFSDAEIAAIANDRLLRELLCVTPICSGELEQVLTALRTRLLDLATGDAAGAVPGGFIEFYCALARQCFCNEYVYALAEGEQQRA